MWGQTLVFNMSCKFKLDSPLLFPRSNVYLCLQALQQVQALTHREGDGSPAPSGAPCRTQHLHELWSQRQHWCRKRGESAWLREGDSPCRQFWWLFGKKRSTICFRSREVKYETMVDHNGAFISQANLGSSLMSLAHVWDDSAAFKHAHPMHGMSLCQMLHWRITALPRLVHLVLTLLVLIWYSSVGYLIMGEPSSFARGVHLSD